MSSFFAWLQIAFILAFTISAISLLVNRVLGRIASLIGLLIVLVNYAVWCAFSYRSLQLIASDGFYLEHPEYLPPVMLGFVGAQWWDFLALILTFSILAYVLCGSHGSALPASFSQSRQTPT